MPVVTREMVLHALAPTPWEFSNKILYDLCSNHPAHAHTDEILGKILLIGRVYAAAIERRKTKTDKDQNDDFYVNTVAPKIRNSLIDQWLNQARSVIPGTRAAFDTLVDVHEKTTNLFSRPCKIHLVLAMTGVYKQASRIYGRFS